jgi:hypothetical protein
MTAPPYPLAALPYNKDIAPWVERMLSVHPRARRYATWHRKMPVFLYKYFSSDRRHSHENLRDVIVGSVLRLDSPSDFNDPFEMAAHFVMTSTDEQKRARSESLAREQAPHHSFRTGRVGLT